MVKTAIFDIPLQLQQLQTQCSALTHSLPLQQLQAALDQHLSLPPWLADLECMHSLSENVLGKFNQMASFAESSQWIDATNAASILQSQQLTEISHSFLQMVQHEQDLWAQFQAIDISFFDQAQHIANSIALTADNAYLLHERLSPLHDLASHLSQELDNTSEPISLPQDFSKEDTHLLAKEAATIVQAGPNWEQALTASFKKLQEKHPVWIGLLKFVLVSLLLQIALNLASTAIGQLLFPAKMHEKPQASSPIIHQVMENQTVVITGDAPYYYEVEIQDAASQQVLTGYISKRSIKICEETPPAAEENVPQTCP